MQSFPYLEHSVGAPLSIAEDLLASITDVGARGEAGEQGRQLGGIAGLGEVTSTKPGGCRLRTTHEQRRRTLTPTEGRDSESNA